MKSITLDPSLCQALPAQNPKNRWQGLLRVNLQRGVVQRWIRAHSSLLFLAVLLSGGTYAQNTKRPGQCLSVRYAYQCTHEYKSTVYFSFARNICNGVSIPGPFENQVCIEPIDGADFPGGLAPVLSFYPVPWEYNGVDREEPRPDDPGKGALIFFANKTPWQAPYGYLRVRNARSIYSRDTNHKLYSCKLKRLDSSIRRDELPSEQCVGPDPKPIIPQFPLAPSGGCSPVASDTRGNPVTLADGSWRKSMSCLKLGGAGLDLNVDVGYNSNMAARGLVTDSALPAGWTSAYTRKMRSELVGSTTVRIITTEDGSEYRFNQITPTTFSNQQPFDYSVLSTDASGNFLLRYPDGRTETYASANGALMAQADRIGNALDISYNSTSNIRTLRNRVTGQAILQKYALVGGVLRLVRIEDAASNGGTARVVSIDYDATGAQLQKFTDVAGRMHQFSYDDPASPALVTQYQNPFNSPSGSGTELAYDIHARVLIENLPNGNNVQFLWRDFSNTDYHLEVKYGIGSTVERFERFLFQTQNVNGAFTSTGRILRQYVVNSTTQYTEFRYDARGNRTDVFDSKGRRTQYLYDANGFLTATREYRNVPAPDGSPFDQTSYAPNSFGQPTLITDAGGTTTAIAYNASTGLPESINRSGATRTIGNAAQTVSQLTKIEYDSAGAGIVLAGSGSPVFPGLPTKIYLPDATPGVWTDNTVVTQQYDSRGYPTTRTVDVGTDKLNLSQSTSFDWRGFLLSSTDFRGMRTAYEYVNDPASGRFGNLGIASALNTDTAGRNVRSEYTRDLMLNLTKTVSDAGTSRLKAETQIGWAMIGMEAGYSPVNLKVLEKMDGATPVWREQQMGYSAFAELNKLTEVGVNDDGSNRVTTLNLDARGWLDNVTLADNRVASRYEYDSDLSGTLASTQDARAVKTSFVWDGKGRLATLTEGTQSIVDNGWTHNAVSALTTFTYDSENRATKAVTALDTGNRTLFESVYDGLDRLQTAIDGSANKNEFYYDAYRNWLIQQNVGDNNINQRQISSFNYDMAGRLREAVVNPGLSPNLALMTTFAYTLPGSTDKWLLQKVTNPRGKATEYSYDSIGNLLRSKDADATSFEYSTNNLGYLTKMASYRPGSSVPINAPTDYTVNLLGEVEALSRNSAGLSPMVEAWQYKSDGALKQMSDLSGQIVRRFYDTTGRLTTTDYAGTTADPNGNRADSSYTYFDNNLLKTATSKPDGSVSESTSYAYDAANRLVDRTRSGRTVNYNYLKDHTLANIIYWNRGSVRFTRNGSGQVQRMDLWGGFSNRSSYGYRSTQQLDSVSRSLVLDGSTKTLDTTFGYDNARRLNKLTYAGTEGSFAVLDYPLLDENSNPKMLVETLRGEAARTTSYSYDNLDRLTQVDYPSVSASIPGYSEIGRYDFTGNRTEVRKNYPSRKSLNHADYNRDGKGDLSWFQSSNGLMNYWLMGGPNGGQFQSSVALMPTNAEAGWKVMLTADFNSDGIPDIVARNFTTGANALWIMGGINGNKRLAILALRAVPGGTWEPAAAADFNNDGNKDLIWRNYSTGENYIWFMGGVDGASNVTERLMGYLGVNWRLCGAGDFDKDGVPDLVWHSPTDGAFTIWRMGGSDGATQQSGGYTASVSTAGLRVDSVADVNGDGNADISWRQLSDGTSFSWLMNGFSIASNLSTSSFAAAGWSSANTNQEMANSVRQIKAYNAFDVVTNGGETSNTNQSLSQTSDAQTYAFDAAERLMKSAQTDGSSIEYLYDALGNLIRSKRTLAGQTLATTTNYIIDESVGLPILLGEITGQDEMLYAHGPDGFHAQRLYTAGTPGITQYALNDRLGSVRMLTNGRDVTSTTHYDAWGQIRSQNGTAKSALGFTGEQNFADGTVYLRARHYLPAQGRFLQRDSIDAGFAGQGTQGHGRFTYAGGRPTATTDPSGHIAPIPAAIIIVAGYGISQMIAPAPTSPALPPTASPGDVQDACDKAQQQQDHHDQVQQQYITAVAGAAMAGLGGAGGGVIGAGGAMRGPARAVPVPPSQKLPPMRSAEPPQAAPTGPNLLPPAGGIPTNYGGNWTRHPNPNGGGTWVNNSPVNAQDVRNVLDKIPKGTPVEIFSGTHGQSNGKFYDKSNTKHGTDGLGFLNEDVRSATQYNKGGHDIGVSDVLRGKDVLRNPVGDFGNTPVTPPFTMSGGRMRDRMHDGRSECIMAWCYSGQNNQIGQQYNSPPN